jgi:hypothetical protein
MSAFQSDLTNLQDTITTALTSPDVSDNITNINVLEPYFVSLGYYSQLQKENDFLTKDMNDNNTDLFTNNRKTFYEGQYIDTLHQWSTIWFCVYMCFLVVYVLLSFFMISNNLSLIVIKCVLLFLYPFTTSYLSQFVLTVLYSLNTKTFLNPYLNIIPSSSNTTFSTPYNYQTQYIS